MPGTYAQLAELSQTPSQAQSEAKQPVQKKNRKAKTVPSPKSSSLGTQEPRNLGQTKVRPSASDESGDEVIEVIRKTLKETGYKNAEIGFTQAEYEAIKDMVYLFSKKGIRTTQVQIARIGISFLVQDHQRKGENSILSKVLMALNR